MWDSNITRAHQSRFVHLFIFLACVVPGMTSTLFTKENTIIAHRGAPCAFPDETMPGYQGAIRHEMDYLEMDLVVTKDGELVLRHDVRLDIGTNIAEMSASGKPFSGRKSSRKIYPEEDEASGFFIADFTLEELLTMNMTQSMPFRDHSVDYDGIKIVTFVQMLDLLKELRVNGTETGLYVEIKDPWFHAQEGFDLPAMLLSAIKDSDISVSDLNEYVAIQCFDFDSLAAFAELQREADLDMPLVWLLDCTQTLPDEEKLKSLADLASFTGVGPDKFMLLEAVGATECGMDTSGPVCEFGPGGRHDGTDCAGRLVRGAEQLLGETDSVGQAFVRLAKSLGIIVHVWTIRNEGQFMAVDFRSDSLAEMDVVMAPAGLNVDGAFVDCPSSALEWLHSLPLTLRPDVLELPPNDDTTFKASSRSAGIVVAFLLLITGACAFTAYASYKQQKRREFEEHLQQATDGSQLDTSSTNEVIQMADTSPRLPRELMGLERHGGGFRSPQKSDPNAELDGLPLREGFISSDGYPGVQSKGSPAFSF